MINNKKKIAFFISAFSVTMLLAMKQSYLSIAVTLIASFFIYYFVFFKTDLLKFIANIKSNKTIDALSSYFAILSIYFNSVRFYNQLLSTEVVSMLFASFKIDKTVGSLVVTLVLSGLALYSIFHIYQYFITKYISRIFMFFKNLECKHFVFFVVIVYAAILLIIFSQTDVFYNSNLRPDIIFTSDISIHLKPLNNSFLQIAAQENDLRQPLFALFALPFAILAKSMSYLFFFIPFSFPYFLMLLQFILLQIIYILITRMLMLIGKKRLVFLIVANCMFSNLLFSIMIEQYVIEMFWLISFVYCYVVKSQKSELLLLASGGSLLTSFVFAPLLAGFTNLKALLVRMIVLAKNFVILVIISGQVGYFLNCINQILVFLNWSGLSKTNESTNTLLQYLCFVKSCFFAPATAIGLHNIYPLYWLKQVTSIDWLGVLLFVMAVIGFIFSYKKRISKISIFWVFFSIVLLGIMGWGAAENELTLYILYFGWSFLILIWYFFEKIISLIKGIPFIKEILIISCLGMLIFWNYYGVVDLINFAIRNYPI